MTQPTDSTPQLLSLEEGVNMIFELGGRVANLPIIVSVHDDDYVGRHRILKRLIKEAVDRDVSFNFGVVDFDKEPEYHYNAIVNPSYVFLENNLIPNIPLEEKSVRKLCGKDIDIRVLAHNSSYTALRKTDNETGRFDVIITNPHKDNYLLH